MSGTATKMMSAFFMPRRRCKPENHIFLGGGDRFAAG